ncbi:Rho-GTPase-activating protein 5 [Choanephora cucurbitarum]|uniref:Rho-GTPase-activating protein 5 n=1 Tax=Choanephora cucurbitarum TaxID=101091 RepID=A0A1C7NHD1_9FUNG|nr:Rho-GTPase-activating protein 5 [Choanephora cucurbitarum]
MSTFEMLGVFTPSQKALIRNWWKKVTAAHPSARKFKDMKVPIVDRGVFGIPLVESIHYAGSNISYIDDTTGTQCFGVIPTIIAKCGAFLKEEAMTTEGIFRVSGSTRRVKMLQSIFDTPHNYGAQLNWRGYSVHDAANLMKRFLNFLPEPVITLDYYEKMKSTALKDCQDLDKKIEEIQSIIQCLPIAHQYLLLYLLDMLGMFAEAKEYTHMDADCLAAVFTPGVLSHPDDALDPAEYIRSQKALSFLIQYQEFFSMPKALHKEIMISNPRLTPQKRSKLRLDKKATMYSCTAGSFSGSGIESIHLNTDHDTCIPLHRSKSAPSVQCSRLYGSYEPQQIVHLNRAQSQNKTTLTAVSN